MKEQAPKSLKAQRSKQPLNKQQPMTQTKLKVANHRKTNQLMKKTTLLLSTYQKQLQKLRSQVKKRQQHSKKKKHRQVKKKLLPMLKVPVMLLLAMTNQQMKASQMKMKKVLSL